MRTKHFTSSYVPLGGISKLSIRWLCLCLVSYVIHMYLQSPLLCPTLPTIRACNYQLPHTGSCMNASGYKAADTQRSVASGDANSHDPRENKERRWRRSRRAKRSSTSPSAASRNRQKHRRRRNNDKGSHNELERCFSWAPGSSS